ncbi:NAD(P)/FAD-dependent oxidoreductase [Deminuibacter soli]|uniref:Amine oxidase domain-containing protein n=1 Tax=Deminuibacter soli TaxID=2291815 RepID=A0A3E1NJX4_9BACT|nr:NAD(P)/FAD-dependent oxidoreductase [Deminuibacter soli]RFM28223.1 hypothetical protein DXN05_11945 [Deminuibacter soli]
MEKKAIIIGAGPAGLTAAYELLKRTDIIPIILEKSGDIGGISKTVNYKGNRMDIGGHRFFSKSDRVMNWWLNILPVQQDEAGVFTINYQNKSREVHAPSANGVQDDRVMLVRKRLSRIYFLRKFFGYPIQLSLETLRKLGLLRTIAILLSYIQAQLFPKKPEHTLEDFFINRFGKTLYKLFFKDYTEKVWGRACNEISAEWGAQRIKGVSISKAIAHAVQSLKPAAKKQTDDIRQKGVETSLIERFLYPKLGPGQLWEEVARQIVEMGGEIHMHHEVNSITTQDHQVTAIEALHTQTGTFSNFEGEYFFSTMPVKELVAGMDETVPATIRDIAAGLQYRDFITVGLLLNKLSCIDPRTNEWKPLLLQDTWIYIQESDVQVGRLQLFNNWSPYMVKNPDTVWVGMEFFCNTTDAFWQMPDKDIQTLAIAELEKIGLARADDVLDSTLLRVEKTYPAYFGTYSEFDKLRDYISQYSNLFLVGRNGMHKYNNADHSMLTAMVSVDNIIAGITDKSNIWSINTEQEYHEEKEAVTRPAETPAPSDLQPGLAAFAQATSQGSFKDFLLRNKWNKLFLWIAGISIVTLFAVFKYYYPMAGFISGDSYAYLQSATVNSSVNTYPIGYSMFLRIYSTFWESDTLLVALQYIFIQSAALYFLYTLCWFYKPGKVIFSLIFIFIVFNPVFLYLSNYVSSDSLFLAVSILWFTQLLWILHAPTNKLIVWHALVLFLAFTIRYNALWYPFISTVAIFLTQKPLQFKLASITAVFVLIAAFILVNIGKYNRISGHAQFSPFSGWQMANNAMYAYRFVEHKDTLHTPAQFKKLDGLIRHYFDTTQDLRLHPQEMLVANTWYMWDPKSPLQVYMNQQYSKDSTATILKRWSSMGPLYGAYGSWLMKKYPSTFTKYYLWPNAMKYYTPPVEFLKTYNMGLDSVFPIAQMWFGYKTTKAHSRFSDYKVTTLEFYPIFTGIMNVLFLSSFFALLFLKGLKQNAIFSGAILLSAGIWVCNFSFSVFASPVALRFQLFPLLVAVCFALLNIEKIWNASLSDKKVI